MKVIEDGAGFVELRQQDYLAEGGEGRVYVRGLTAYKVYTDPGKMLPLGKIQELSVLADDRIIRPLRVLRAQAGGAPVGYTMRFVSGAVPLCQVFPRAYREREGLTPENMLALVRELCDLVRVAHAAGVLIVDCNELNFLVKGAELVAIDVDSWQTPHYPAPMIMPSVRDYRAGSHFTEGSDWFSAAVLCYQLFTGLHPYRGRHPSLNTLEERMRAGISVFDPAVSVPKVAYPHSVIPPVWLSWLRAVLQDGRRDAPPLGQVGVSTGALLQAPTGEAVGLIIALVRDFGEPLRGYVEDRGRAVAWSASTVWVDGRARPAGLAAACVSERGLALGCAVLRGEQLQVTVLGSGETHTIERVRALTCAAGSIYLHRGEAVDLLGVVETPTVLLMSPREVTRVLPHATRLFPGCAIQDMLGSVFVSVYPRAGFAPQLRVPELDGRRLVDARCEGRVLMCVVATQTGAYERWTFLLDEHFGSIARIRTVTDADQGLNFVVLDDGVVAHMIEQDRLEIWRVSAPASARIIEDPTLSGDMRLVRVGGRLGFLRGSAVYSMRMRSPS